MAIIKPIEERSAHFFDKISKLNKNYEIVGEYVNNKTPIRCYCLKHDYYWEPTPDRLLRGCGCPKCGKESIGLKHKKTQEEFEKEILDRYPQIKILSQINGTNRKVKCLCTKHSFMFERTPEKLKINCGCTECQKEINRKEKHYKENFINKISKINPHIEIIGEYIDVNAPIKCRCKVCGYEWSNSCITLYHHRNCPLCKNQVVVKGKNDIATTNPELVPYFKNIDDAYTHCSTNDVRIDFKCPTCGNIVNRLLRDTAIKGFHCSFCDKGVSLPNRIIRNLLKRLTNNNYEYEYSPDWAGNYKYDAYFEKDGKKYIVEMDGGLHFKMSITFPDTPDRLQETQERDRIKDKLAEDHGIIMIRVRCVPETLENITRQIKKSLLADIFDLENIDIKETFYYDKTLLVDICDRYNSMKRKSAKIISKELGMCVDTVREFLKHGAKLDLCDYDTKKAKIGNGNNIQIKRINAETGEFIIYDSIDDMRKKIYSSGDTIQYITLMKHIKNQIPYKGYLYEKVFV